MEFPMKAVAWVRKCIHSDGPLCGKGIAYQFSGFDVRGLGWTGIFIAIEALLQRANALSDVEHIVALYKGIKNVLRRAKVLERAGNCSALGFPLTYEPKSDGF